MKKNNDKDNKDPQPEVYVVACDRRRTSDRNFTNEEDAKREGTILDWYLSETMILLQKFPSLKPINQGK